MNICGIIFSDYNGTLQELTHVRTVASLPFGGRYRQIDFILSNMVNSEISSVGVITKSNYRSLMLHLGSSQEWDLNRKNGGLTLLPPFATGNIGNYRGALDELQAALLFLKAQNTPYVLLADSSTICNIDFRPVLRTHIVNNNDVTVIATKASEPSTQKFDVVLESEDGLTASAVSVGTFVKPGEYSGMGMFLMGREALIELIEDSAARGLYHFDRDFLQRRFNKGELKIGIHTFDGIVLCNSDLASYYKNSMALLNETVKDSLFRPESPIYTKVNDEIPTFFGMDSNVSNSSIAGGCSIEGTVEGSILFRNVKIGKGAIVKNSIIMKGSVVSDNAVLDHVIVDKNATISPYTWLYSTAGNPLVIQKGETV